MVRLTLALVVLGFAAASCAQAPKPTRDFKRIVRVYQPNRDGRAGKLYTREASVGDRLLLSADASTTVELNRIAALGVSLFKSETDPLSTPEVSDGTWDWRAYNAERLMAANAGADWGLFLHASFPPPWYRKQTEFAKLTCLQHLEPVQAFSPWSPDFAKFLDRCWSAARARYGEIAAVTLGIHGDYGEAGLMTGLRMKSAEQKTDWVKRFGDEHNHLDFWCGDANARESFRKAMLAMYGSLDALNEAWLTAYERPEEIGFPVTPQLSYRARLDFIGWYTNGVTSLADTIAKIARRYYPNALMMIPIGAADESVRIGHDVSALARVASRYNAALRCTNGGFQLFARNHAITLAKMRAASRYYRVPLWIASAAPSNATGFSQRLFEALCSGATGYFDWNENWRAHAELAERYLKQLTHTQPIVEIACLFPSSTHELRPTESYPPLMLRGIEQLRDYVDYDVLDERLVQDGALTNYKVAILWEGTIWRKETLDRLQDWVESGGILIAYDFGKFSTPEGDQTPFNSLFGFAGSLPRFVEKERAQLTPSPEWARPFGKGHAVYFPATRAAMESYLQLICRVLFGPASPGLPMIGLPEVDNRRDGVYSTLCTDRVLLYNSMPEPVSRTIDLPDLPGGRAVTVEAGSLAVALFEPTPHELLLQCELFTDLNKQPLSRSVFCSPGAGETAVAVAANKKISTRVAVPKTGTYRIFARTVIGGQTAPAKLSIEDVTSTATPKRPRYSDVIDYGSVTLEEGVHTIVLSHSAPFLADYVLLTNDSAITGYRFAFPHD